MVSLNSRSQVRGFSLVELMIAVTIGLLIVAALAGVLATSSGASKTNQRSSEIQSNGRYALDVLRGDLRSAGFRGYTWAEPNAPAVPWNTAINSECLETGATAYGFVSNLRQGVWGTDDWNPFSTSLNCIPSGNYADGDVLVIRKLSGTPVSTLDYGMFYFRTNYAAGEVFQAPQATDCPATNPVTPSPFNKVPCINGVHGRDLNDFLLQIHVYYISPYTSSPTEIPLVPALYRAKLTFDPVALRPIFKPELVASGIEHMQVQYGRATTDLNTRYDNARDFSNQHGITGTSYETLPTEWDDVNAVRIWLLAKNSTTELGYVNTNTYVMGNQSYTVNDSYRRQLFSTVVQLRN